MPIGTYGTVKAMTPEELTALGAQIILGNTFHLMLRPGMEVVRAHGGLHRFMHWNGPILTDSGGFQVFSLATLRKITEEGVSFRSPVNGDTVLLTPERSMQVQRDLDSDIVMIFDECTPYPATETEARRRWSCRCAGRRAAAPSSIAWKIRTRCSASSRAVCFPRYARSRSRRLAQIGFDGYAIGGLAVGEPKDERERCSMQSSRTCRSITRAT